MYLESTRRSYPLHYRAMDCMSRTRAWQATEDSTYMKLSPSILVYGRDTCLLQTRGLVLQQAGYRVAVVQDWFETHAHKTIDLVILCHSLTAQQRREALVAPSDQWPTAKKLA
jgi:hypothetical protein